MHTIIANKGTQGAHTYYTATVKWGELDQLLVFPEELKGLDEDNQMQRTFAQKRMGKLVEYLDQDNHFFSALTLIILPRDLEHPAVEGDVREDDADYQFKAISSEGLPVASQKLGGLSLSGQVRLFPADGQHRARAAVEKMETFAGIAKEEVPVVLIPYENYGQVRQLFADLNRNAKIPSRATSIDFDSRDPIVQVVKAAADLVPLFEGRINRNGNSLPKSSTAVITLSTLETASQDILKALAKKDGVDIDEYVMDADTATKALAEVWTEITDLFPDERDRILDGEEKAAGDIRDKFVFAYGLGQQGLALAASQLIAGNDDWAARLQKAAGALDWRREAEVWKGNAVLHTEKFAEDGTPYTTYRVNNTKSGISDLARKVVTLARQDGK